MPKVEYYDVTVENAENILKQIKDNVYSFETDSGKADMVTGNVFNILQFFGIVNKPKRAPQWLQVKLFATNSGQAMLFILWTKPKATKTTPRNYGIRFRTSALIFGLPVAEIKHNHAAVYNVLRRVLRKKLSAPVNQSVIEVKNAYIRVYFVMVFGSGRVH